MKEIAPNVYVSTDYAYVNVGCVVGPTGVIAVDVPTLPEDAVDWRRQIAEITDQPVVYTALTDVHPHRLLCAGLLEAPVVASRRAYEQAADYSRGFWRNVLRRLRREHPEQSEALKSLRPPLPRLLFSDNLFLHKGGTGMRMERVAGAAPGSGSVKLDETPIVFLGDTVVAGEPPVMDECPDTKEWLNTLTQLRRPYLSDVTFIPGRGPIGDQSTTEPLSEYIRLVRRRVRSMHRRGQSRDDVADFVDEALSVFPLSDEERPRYRRRVRNGLKQVYDELAPDQDDG